LQPCSRAQSSMASISFSPTPRPRRLSSTTSPPISTCRPSTSHFYTVSGLTLGDTSYETTDDNTIPLQSNAQSSRRRATLTWKPLDQSPHCSGLTLGDTGYAKLDSPGSPSTSHTLFRVDSGRYKLHDKLKNCGRGLAIGNCLLLSFEPIVESLVQTHQGRLKVIQAASHNQQA
jgi:hypothetical protein